VWRQRQVWKGDGRRYMLVLAAVAVLSGCGAPGLEVTGGPDTLATRSLSGDRVAGQQSSFVRTYRKDAAGKEVEIGNAVFTLRSAELSGRIRTPSEIRYPVFLQGARFANRGKPSPLKITCRADGKQAVATVEAFPRGAKDVRTDSYGGTGTISATTTVLSSRLSSSFPWAYPYGIRIVLPE